MASPTTHTANAIAAITNRGNLPVPEIDFTQHQLENGEVVSTTERVVKDVSCRVTLAYRPCTREPPMILRHFMVMMLWTHTLLRLSAAVLPRISYWLAHHDPSVRNRFRLHRSCCEISDIHNRLHRCN